MHLADTSAFLALIVDDRPAHSAFAEAALEAGNEPVLVLESVLAETLWVLTSAYGYGRAEAAAALLDALSGSGIRAWDTEEACETLTLMKAEPTLGFVDCLLVVRGLNEDAELVTFDARLARTAQQYVRI